MHDAVTKISLRQPHSAPNRFTDDGFVCRFDERDQDALCGPAENKTAPKPSQAKNLRRPSSDVNHCGCVV
jgi:hypothetical protein